MNLSNREELIVKLQEAAQPDPQAQQAQMAQMQAQMAMQEAQTQAFAQQAAEFQAKAAKTMEEAKYVSYKAETDRVKAVSASKEEAPEDKDFEKRARLAELVLKEKELDFKKDMEKVKIAQDAEAKEAESAFMGRLNE